MNYGVISDQRFTLDLLENLVGIRIAEKRERRK